MQTILVNSLLCILVILFIVVSIGMIKDTFFNDDKVIKKEQNERSMESVWISSLSNNLPLFFKLEDVKPKKDDFVNSILHQKDQQIIELELELEYMQKKWDLYKEQNYIPSK